MIDKIICCSRAFLCTSLLIAGSLYATIAYGAKPTLDRMTIQCTAKQEVQVSVTASDTDKDLKWIYGITIAHPNQASCRSPTLVGKTTQVVKKSFGGGTSKGTATGSVTCTVGKFFSVKGNATDGGGNTVVKDGRACCKCFKTGPAKSRNIVPPNFNREPTLQFSVPSDRRYVNPN